MYFHPPTFGDRLYWHRVPPIPINEWWYTERVIPTLTGWVCPICGKVYSPNVSCCPDCKHSSITITTTNETKES